MEIGFRQLQRMKVNELQELAGLDDVVIKVDSQARFVLTNYPPLTAFEVAYGCQRVGDITKMARGWSERQAQILEALSMLTDGATPSELAREIGISTLYAAIYLSRYKKLGIVVKLVCDDGKCRYKNSDKGERKRAYLQPTECREGIRGSDQVKFDSNAPATKEDIKKILAKQEEILAETKEQRQIVDELAAKEALPELTSDEIVARFLEDLHRSSEGTKQGRLRICKMWLDFAYARTSSPKKWNKSLVIEWFNFLEERGYAKSTQRKMQGITKRVFDAAGVKWPMGKRDMVEVRPSDMQTPVAKPEFIKAMIVAAKAGRLRAVETAFLALSTTYGLRGEELLRVRPEDIDYDTGRIYIRTVKHGVEREHLLPGEIVPYLRRYNFERRYTRQTLVGMWRAIERKAGLVHIPWCSIHSIRRSILTALRPWSHINAKLFLRWKMSGDMAIYYDKSDPIEIDREVFERHPFLPMWRLDIRERIDLDFLEGWVKRFNVPAFGPEVKQTTPETMASCTVIPRRGVVI